MFLGVRIVQSRFIAVMSVVALSLSSCNKKSVPYRVTRSGTRFFYDQKAQQSTKCTADQAASNTRCTLDNVGTITPTQTSPVLSVEQQQQALLDVPLPIDARTIAGYDDDITEHALSLVRHTSLTQAQLLDFYDSMLEQAGWRIAGRMRDRRESLMIWERPRKLCVVSLRSMGVKKGSSVFGKTRIIIQVCERKRYKL